jgi:hypothetical protein
MHLRFFVLVFMMVLLPLRGWTGDAMATDMAVNIAAQKMHQETSTSQKGDAHHEPQAHEEHSDHAAHDQGHGDDHSADHNAGTCESCSACQACHTVALLVTSDALKPILNTLWTPSELADPYASADAALDQKPPIS